MTQKSVSNLTIHRNGHQADPMFPPDNEVHDAWKQEHPRYAGWHQHEPLFVHSVKWHDPESGIEHMTVIRADDMDELFVKVRTVTHMVKMARQKAQDVPDAQASREGWCNSHSVQMTRSKDGKGYYHKVGEKPDGKAIWCRGT